jgi:hypothetical protein
MAAVLHYALGYHIHQQEDVVGEYPETTRYYE